MWALDANRTRSDLTLDVGSRRSRRPGAGLSLV